MSQLLGSPTGTLRINASVTIGQHLISPLLPEFLETYPDIKIQFLTTNRLVNLVDEGFDLAIRAGELEDSTYVSKYLCTAKLYLYASKHYVDQYGEPHNPDDLVNHHCLSMGNTMNAAPWHLTNEIQDQEITVSSRVIVYDFTILRHLVNSGNGIAVLPSYLLREPPFSENITRVLAPWRGPHVELHAIFPSRQGVTPKIRVFLDFLAQKFDQDPLLEKP